jgi:hypothetical protein
MIIYLTQAANPVENAPERTSSLINLGASVPIAVEHNRCTLDHHGHRNLPE